MFSEKLVAFVGAVLFALLLAFIVTAMFAVMLLF